MRYVPLLLLLTAACSPATPAQAPAPERTASDRTTYRRAVGGLAAGYLFQTHMAIGTTADLLGEGVYQSDEVRQLMETTVGMGKNVSEMLEDVEALHLEAPDQRTLEELIVLNEAVVNEARALIAFADRRSKENAERFQQERADAWRRLARLLNLRRPE